MPMPRGFQFVKAPPDKAMRRQSPASAPRLFEWLVEEGYVTPVMQVRSSGKKGRKLAGEGKSSSGRSAAGKRPSAKASAAALASRGFRGGGRAGSAKKKKKNPLL